jgi:hypothetical protein
MTSEKRIAAALMKKVDSQPDHRHSGDGSELNGGT